MLLKKGPQEVLGRLSLCPSFTLSSPLNVGLPNVHINIVLEAQSPWPAE